MTSHPPNFTPLVRELLLHAAVRRQPVNGTFELTNRCNLSCRMCYVRHSAGDRALCERELTVAAWLTLARDAVDHGMVFLQITGGEVFLRPDFFDIYEPLTRLGLVITLLSNGTLITEAIAQRLSQAPPSSTEITLYGATAHTYEAVTGVPGSYARCCAGVETLLSHNVPLGRIKTTVTRQNVRELESMRRMAHNWGIPFSADWLLSRRRDGTISNVEDCRLTASDCVALEATNRAFAVEKPEVVLRESIHDSNFFCLAGKGSFVVTPYGEMNICLDMAMPAARPLETGFKVAWEQVQQFVDAAPPVAPVCLDCDVRGYCSRCPAWSFLETHTLTEPIPYLCDIASSRKSSMLLPE
ncbi:MAG: radical SAM protein [Nitrospirota bacterium]